MTNKTLSAKVANVQIGNLIVEGILLETGEYAIAQQQVARLFSVIPTSAPKWLRKILGSDAKLLSVKTNRNTKVKGMEAAITLEQFNFVLQKLSCQGNPIAQRLLYGEVIAAPNQKKPSSSTHVYVIGDEDRNVCKIGIAKDPEKRLCGIQTSYPFPLSIFFAKRVTNARKKEQSLHRALDDYRLNGEWFEMDALKFVDWDSL